MVNKRCSFWVFCLFLLAPLAHSAEINFRGFASFVGGKGSSDEVETLGYMDDFDFSNDSLIALQTDADLGEGLSATMQVMSRGKNNYDARVEWAYFTYEFTESVQLSAGKIRIPFYRYSDFIDVRYAYNWLAVPDTVYGFELPGFDGLSMLSTYTLGDWDFNWQLIYGELEGDFDGEGTMGEINGLTGLSLMLVRDWLTFRVGYMQSEVTINADFSGALQVLNGQLGITDQDDKVLVEDDNGSFLGVALGIDYNNFIADAEYITYEIEDSFLPTADAYYLALGYRFGKYIPLITYSENSSNVETNFSNTGIPQLDAGLQAFASGTETGSEDEIEILDLSLRNDFHHSAALKTSVSRVSRKDEDDETVLRVGIDLVF